MKRIELNKIGIENPLHLTSVEIPSPGEGEVLIKTKAFGINPVDVKTRNGGGIYGRLKNDAPIVLGWDISGEIVSIGENIDNLKLGDKIFGMINFPGHGMAYAEYAIAPANHLAFIPKNIDFGTAAATTLAALTAYQILSRHIKPNYRVFIQAAAGGVGHFAVQIAKIMGAYVIGTGSKKNEAYLKSIGLDEYIDYTEKRFENCVSDVDFALDTMGGEILERTISIVKNGGRIISIPTGVSANIKELALSKNINVDFELVESNGDNMTQLANWLSSGKLIPFVSKTYTFAEIEQAHKQILTGSTRGKLIVSLE